MAQQITKEQIAKATIDFEQRTKTHFSALAAILKNKTPTIEYDLSTDFYFVNVGEDTENEKFIKRLITKVREEIQSNLHKY